MNIFLVICLVWYLIGLSGGIYRLREAYTKGWTETVYMGDILWCMMLGLSGIFIWFLIFENSIFNGIERFGNIKLFSKKGNN